MPVLVATAPPSPLHSPKTQPSTSTSLSRTQSSQQLATIQHTATVEPPAEENHDCDSGASSTGTAVPFPRISQRKKLVRGVGTQPWHYRDNDSGSDSETDAVPPILSPPIVTPIVSPRKEHPPELDCRRTYSESQLLTPSALTRGLAGHVRKKSGEIVKSSLKSPSVSSLGPPGRISIPTTPSLEKFVHFDAQLENIRLFNKEQKPAAVSRDNSACSSEESDDDAFVDRDGTYYPGSSEEEKIRLSLILESVNLPARHAAVIAPAELLGDSDVTLQRVALASDGRSVEGTVLVRNIAFEKWVAIRFTFDWWQTTSEVTAKYTNSAHGVNIDVFSFSIRLPDVIHRIEEKQLFLAIRFSVVGREMWDNNCGQNYQFRFKRASPPRPKKTQSSRHPPSWPVKSANVDQMADLRKTMERVYKEEDEETGLNSWDSLTARLRARNIDLEEDRDARKAINLRKRYNFADSSKVKWEPPTDLPKYNAPPLTTSRVSFPGTTTFSRPNTSPPSIRLPADNGFSWRSPRASPRDVDVENAHQRKFFLDPREARNDQHGHRSFNDSPGARTRLHQRGGGYFDAWAEQGAIKAQITPVTSRASPAPVVQTSKPPSPGPAASSSTESIVTEDSKATEEVTELSSETEGYASSIASSSATSIAEIDASLKLDASDSTSTIADHSRAAVRFNSYPMDRSNLTPTNSGMNSPLAGPPSLVTTPARHSESWPLSPMGSMSSVASTPSITSASSPSQCPSSPSEYPNASPFGGLLGVDLNVLLSRYCYYTGNGANAHQHSHSDPSVDASMWNLGRPASTSPGIVPSSPPYRRHSLEGVPYHGATTPGTESGRTTPTPSMMPNGEASGIDADGSSPGKSYGARTPRPGSPNDLDATPRIAHEGFIRPYRGSL